jgi:uncharacterized protein YbjT (DUF2867 family)
MAKVLITGGTGVYGTALVPRLLQAGHGVRIMSRRPPAGPVPAGADWAVAQIETGSGLDRALAGVEVVVHAASSPFKRTWAVDVDGTQRLLEAARAAGIAHLVYISIVGIERVPFAYYRAKLAGEDRVQAGGVPWTLLRATQFHNLLDTFLRLWSIRWPAYWVPCDLQYQPVDVGEVAAVTLQVLAAGPSGRWPDVGGPEVLRTGHIARTWLQARGIRRPVWHLPLPGAMAAAFRAGRHTCPDRRVGRVTWAAWLEQRYGRRPGQAVRPAAEGERQVPHASR